MLELVTCAQLVPSHDISMTTVAVPVPDACITSAGAARATITSVVGPVVVAGAGERVPLGHPLVAAAAFETSAPSTSGTRNLALPARSLANVFARFACRFVCVDALEPGFVTCRAYAAVDLPAFAALAEN